MHTFGQIGSENISGTLYRNTEEKLELTHKGLLKITKLPDNETIFGEQAEVVYPLLSKKQNKAINRYCAHGGIDKADACYDQINECIERITNSQSVELTNKFYKSATAILSSFAHSIEIRIPVLYRGIRRKIQAEQLAMLKVGDTYQSKQAMSTSHSALVAFSNLDQNVALKIYDAHGLPLAHNYAEGEVLIDPRAKFKIRDIYIEDWDNGKSTKVDILVYELVMLPLKSGNLNLNLHKQVFEIVFYTISMIFVISVIRTSILVPQLFNEANAYKFDSKASISGPDQRQIALVESSVGLGQPYFLLSLSAFIGLYFYVFISPKGKKFKAVITKILGATITVSGILITIFSVWRAS